MSQTQQIFPFHVNTNKSKRPVEPNFSKENPLRIPMFVNGLNLTMDAEFQEKAAVLVLIDGVRKFDSTDEENSFKGHLKYSIPLGHPLPRDKKVEVFVWNDVDDNFIECSFDLFLDEFLKPLQSESVPLGIDIFNQMVSSSEILFPNQVWGNDEQHVLINMRGYKKMIVLFSSSADEPEIVSASQSQPELIVDGDLSTKTPLSGVIAYNVARTTIIDFGSIAERNLKAKYKQTKNTGGNPTSVLRARLFISDDDIDYTQVAINTGDAISTLDGGLETFRYAKLILDTTSVDGGISWKDEVYEIYNSDIIGGEASLSFEILDESSNKWIPYITSSQIGTVSTGQNIKRIIGDVVDEAIAGQFNKPLPPTQTGFRATLITTANVAIGISMRLMA